MSVASHSPATRALDPVVRAWVLIHCATAAMGHRLVQARSDDRGQATAEYALVILGAAAVAALLMAWAGQTNRITRLLDSILDNVIKRFR